ncbi:MAG: 1-acyl-sn-glycerol-3-phosphate acyltransferase [Flavobacteriaceae bacterium]|nr:1-acyl-sn-glycerol-3-phosphate acyltransferase [Flavobacteriaceae bacterium]
MYKLFLSFYETFTSKKIIVFTLLGVFLSVLLYFSLKIDFEEDISKLIPQNEETKTLNSVLKNVDFSDKIVVNVLALKNGNPDKLASYASELIDSLNVYCKPYIASIDGEFTSENMMETMDFVYKNLPLFLTANDYEEIAQKLEEEAVEETVKGNLQTLISPTGFIAKNSIRKDPFGITFKGLKKLESLKMSNDFKVHNGFLMTADKNNLLLFIKPKLSANETDANTVFVKQLYQIAAALSDKYKDEVSAEYYGSTVIAVANANQIKNDIKYTVSIAMVLLLVILIFFYKKITIPFILFLPTLIGALTAITALYFIRVKVSAISLGIGSVLLGITLDYSLHILTHFKSNQNIKQLYKEITMPILMSSITTAIAFICLLLLKSQALQDLGIFASISVLASSVAALLFIPLLYTPKKELKAPKEHVISKIASYNFDKNKWIIIGFVLLLVACSFTFKQVRFNNDLSKMNYMDAASITAEKNLDTILNLSSKSIYVVAHHKNLDTVLSINTRINSILKKAKENGGIQAYSSVGGLVLSKRDQQLKINEWNAFWTPTKKEQLRINLKKYGAQVGFKENTYVPFYTLLDTHFEPVSMSDYAGVKSLFTKEFVNDKDLCTAVSIVQLNIEDKEALETVLSELSNVLVIDRKHINETFLGSLKEKFSTLINYSFLAVFLVLFLFYRNLELTVFTSIPIFITWVITLGLMSFFNIQFTIFNVIVSTFIFGLGVDYSIFMTNGLVHDYTYGTKKLKTYKISIILSVLTTILGIGVLVFAKHPALRSISVLSLIGILTTIFVTFTLQPLLFRLFVSGRASVGFRPLKLRSSLHAIISLLLYALGGMLLSLLSLVLLPLIPIAKKKKMLFLHKTVAWLVQFVLYGNRWVKKKVVNAPKEGFSKPAIIIANHVSSLDTLTMGLVTHKIVYLVNDWVYKSPVFGILARVLGFFPVSNGVDQSVDHLEEKVKQGYSLVVFPEGKRSLTNRPGRFHKGAFFLQEKLKIDILPIYFHGNAEVMAKNDFVIQNGSMTAVVGERISYDSLEHGKTVRERTKKIGAFYKNELLQLREELEGASYFKEILYSNYLYKETYLLKAVRKDFEAQKETYLTLNNMISKDAKILHVGNDLGQVDILLISKHLTRKIYSYNAVKEHKMVAENCYTNMQRKVIHLEALEDATDISFTTLLLNRISLNEVKGLINFSKFESIVLLNSSYIDELDGFYVAQKNKNSLLLKKNDLEK